MRADRKEAFRSIWRSFLVASTLGFWFLVADRLSATSPILSDLHAERAKP